jgi:hypothetical protein
MNMIGHYDITSNHPTMVSWRRTPRSQQNLSCLRAIKQPSPIYDAGGQKIDRVFDPESRQPLKMAALGQRSHFEAL